MGSDSRAGARPVLAVAVAGLVIAGDAGTPIRSSPALRLVAYHGRDGLADPPVRAAFTWR